jgi:hypothetical protein
VGFGLQWSAGMSVYVTAAIGIYVQMGILKRLSPLSSWLTPRGMQIAQIAFICGVIIAMAGFIVQIGNLGKEPKGILSAWLDIGEIGLLGFCLMYEIFQSIYAYKLLQKFIIMKERTNEYDGIEVSKLIIKRMMLVGVSISCMDVLGLGLYVAGVLFDEDAISMIGSVVLYLHILAVVDLFANVVQITFIKVKRSTMEIKSKSAKPFERYQDRETVKL